MEFKANVILLENGENFENTIEHDKLYKLAEYDFEIENKKYYLNTQILLFNNRNEISDMDEGLIYNINNSLVELIKQYHPIRPYFHNLILHNNSINIIKHSSCIITPILPENKDEDSLTFMYKVVKHTNYNDAVGFHSESVFILTKEDTEKDYKWVDEYFESLFQIIIKNIPSSLASSKNT